MTVRGLIKLMIRQTTGLCISGTQKPVATNLKPVAKRVLKNRKTQGKVDIPLGKVDGSKRIRAASRSKCPRWLRSPGKAMICRRKPRSLPHFSKRFASNSKGLGHDTRSLCDGSMLQPQKESCFIRREEVLERFKVTAQRHQK